jgi:hypothetical protein
MLSGAAAILALTILGMSFLVVNFWPTEGPFAPLSVSDVEINTRVEGVVGPATYVGKSYKGTITICNNDNRTHTITFIIQWERLSGAVRFVSGGSIEFPMEPGCETLTGESAPLPVEVSSGLWRESTAAIVQRGDRKQTVSFVSEPFQVVPLD